VKTPLCITAKLIVEWQSEHLLTAVPQKADIARRGWQGRKVPHSDIRADDVLALFRKRYPYQ
jgi:hypothetical protein